VVKQDVTLQRIGDLASRGINSLRGAFNIARPFGEEQEGIAAMSFLVFLIPKECAAFDLCTILLFSVSTITPEPCDLYRSLLKSTPALTFATDWPEKSFRSEGALLGRQG
jgi:hypothetical protein